MARIFSEQKALMDGIQPVALQYVRFFVYFKPLIKRLNSYSKYAVLF